jgi:CBS domain containing-hemolysin-like protein
VGSELLAIALCLLGSAFFSGSETALTSLPLTRLEALRERKGRLTRLALDRWADAPQHVIATILVGNTLVNILASALATSISYQLTGSNEVAWVVGIMTLVILLFGEVTPKALARLNADRLAPLVAPPLYLLDLVLRPVTWALGLLARVLARRSEEAAPVTEEDLVFMLRLAHRHAQLPHEARHQIESVLRLHRAIAREIMTPRPKVLTVDVAWGPEELRSFVAGQVHSRFPVVRGSPDDIVGVLHARSLLRLEPGQPWSDIVLPPVFIPETRAVADLLQDFRRRGQHLAIVLDEFGGLSGVVTLEDVLELVVGEIEDEFDLERETAIVRQGDGWLVPGHLALRRLERLLHHSFTQPDEVDSVGGLLAWRLGEELAAGATLEWEGVLLRVEELRDGRPSRVLAATRSAAGT